MKFHLTEIRIYIAFTETTFVGKRVAQTCIKHKWRLAEGTGYFFIMYIIPYK